MDMLSRRWVRGCSNIYCIDCNCFPLHGSFHPFALLNEQLRGPRHHRSALFSSVVSFFGTSQCLCVQLCWCHRLLQLLSSWVQQLSSKAWSEVNSCQVSGILFPPFLKNLLLHACRQLAEYVVGGENQLSSAEDKVNVATRASYPCCREQIYHRSLKCPLLMCYTYTNINNCISEGKFDRLSLRWIRSTADVQQMQA